MNYCLPHCIFYCWCVAFLQLLNWDVCLCIRANTPPWWSPDLLCSQVLNEFSCSTDWLTHASSSCVFFSHVSVINPMSILLSASSWFLFLTDLALRVVILRYGVVTVPPKSVVLTIIKFWVFIFLGLSGCLVDVVTFHLFILHSLTFFIVPGWGLDIAYHV